MRECNLRESIWYFILNEYLESNDERIPIFIEDFIEEFNNDLVNIAESTFESLNKNYEYDSKVVFVPSENKLIKYIYNLDTCIELKEIITFNSIEETDFYFGNASFDDILQPCFDDEILDYMTTKKEKVR